MAWGDSSQVYSEHFIWVLSEGCLGVYCLGVTLGVTVSRCHLGVTIESTWVESWYLKANGKRWVSVQINLKVPVWV